MTICVGRALYILILAVVICGTIFSLGLTNVSSTYRSQLLLG